MARARNIKPAFFDNDELAELDPLARLLFIGFWTISDFKGDFEWREKRVKAKLLPYDKCDIKKLAINLDESGFIRFYSDGDKLYCNVVNFTTHQNPHKNEREKGSDVPEYTSHMRQAIDLHTLTINHDKSGLIRNDSDSNRADSFNPDPDSLKLIPDVSKPKRKVFAKPTREEIFIFSNSEKINVTGFFDYYESNGWKVGRNIMKDWKAAARGWSKRQNKFAPNQPYSNDFMKQEFK